MDSFEIDESQKRFIESSVIPYAVYLFVDRRIVTIAVSDGLCELLGLKRSEAVDLMNNDMYRGTHPDDVSRVADLAYQFAVGGDNYDAVYRTKSKSGKYIVVHARGKKVRAKDGTPLAFVWYMTEPLNAKRKIEAERQLAAGINNVMRDENMFHRNNFDTLTGLPNMTHFLELAQNAVENSKTAGKTPKMIFFDLTGMKSFNGKFGYSEGDKLIRAVADLLKSHFTSDGCGRIAQDHFIAYSDAEDIEAELNAISKEAESINDGNNLPLRAGIYADKYDAIDVSLAYDRAKIACDTERMARESRFTYYDLEMRKMTIKRDYILNNFEKAMNDKWIRAFYQPIIRAGSGHICDEEALCRWIDPDRGVIPPNEFINVLEEAKLIYKLDLYMVDRIIEDFATKKAEGIKALPVSVNLSRYDFKCCDMVKEITKRMDKAGLPHYMLSVEITENCFEIDETFLREQIRCFRENGFKVWMDDFGSGYSSLNALAEWDFDLIKFDMIFLKKFDSSPKSRIILRQLLHMTQKLGIQTIVEGVETEEQMNFLKEAGCDMCQGYYFDKPSPLPDIIDKIKTGMSFVDDRPEEEKKEEKEKKSKNKTEKKSS